MIVSVERGELLSAVAPPRERSVFLLEQARVLAGVQPALAVELCDEAQTLATQEGDEAMLARIRSLTGRCYCTLGAYGLALDYFRDALHLYGGSVRDDARTLLLPYHGNDHRALLGCLLRSFDGGEPDTGRIISVLTELGCLLFDRKDYSEALEHCMLACTLCADTGDREAHAALLLFLGRLQACLGRYAAALDSCNNSMIIRRELGDDRGMAAVYASLGVLYADTGRLPEALDCLAGGATLCEQADMKETAAVLLVTMGGLHEKAGHYEQAQACYGRGLQLGEQCDDKTLCADALQGLAEAGLALGTYTSALRHALAALSCRNTCDHSGLIAAHSTVERCYAAVKKPEQALAHLEQAAALAPEGQASQALHLYSRLADLCRLTGDVDRALEYMERYHAARQEIYRQEYHSRIETMMMLYAAGDGQNETGSYPARPSAETDRQNRRLLHRIMQFVHRQEVERNLRSAGRDVPVSQLSLLVRRLKQRITGEGWTAFEQRFRVLSGDFLTRLCEVCSTLSPAEVRVCSLLKLGLSSKDSAQILGVSVRCIETHRYSIRRKLRLPAGANLTEFLAEF